MKFQLAVAAVLALVLNAEAEEVWNMTMKCKGEEIQGEGLAKGDMECIVKYIPEMANMPEDKDEKMKKFKEFAEKIVANTCIGVCRQQTLGILDASGAYNADKTVALINSIFPGNVRTSLSTAFQQCATDNMAGKTLTMDNKCADYKGMMDCIGMKFMEICEIKLDEMFKPSA